MNQAKRDGKRGARERLAAERERQRQRKRRNRMLAIYGSALAVVVIAVVVGLVVANLNSGSVTSAFTAPKGAVVDPYVNATTKTNDATAIEYGSPDAKVTMTVFEDVRCPYCDVFELGAKSVYNTYVTAGQVRVLFHMVKLIDNKQGTANGGSRWGGSALACAQSAGRFDAYHDVLFANQPAETSDGFASTATLISLTAKVPGLDSPAFEACVRDESYGGLVDQNYTDFSTLGLQGTPTVMIDGTQLTDTQMFSASSTAGITATTSDITTGANVSAIRAALQTAVTKAYGAGAATTTTP